MGDAVLIEIVRAARDQICDAGVASFTVGDLQALDARLAKIQAKEIDRALFQLWQWEGGAHAEALGEDGCHLWAFVP